MMRSLHLFLQYHAGGPVIVGYPGLLKSVWPALSRYPYLEATSFYHGRPTRHSNLCTPTSASNG